MKKRLVSLLLSLLMVLTLLPVPALAEESGGATDAEPDIAVQAAEEEIPTEDGGEEKESPSSTVIIDSITCVDADEDGYVRIVEGSDVSFGFDAEGNMEKSVHSGGVGGWHYKVKYTDTATGNREEVTGDWSAIQDATGYKLNHHGEHSFDSDNQRIPWKAEEKYAVTVELGGKSITVNLLITANPVKSIQYRGDANTPIELVRGEDGQYGPQDDPDSGEWQYYPWRRNDVKFLVEIDGVGKKETSCNRFYNDTGMHLSTQWYNNGNGMTAGAIYPAWIGCNGVGCVVKFKISEEPTFASITPLYGATPEDPLILKENSSGYDNGGVFNYGIDSAQPQPQYTVILTEAGKARYNIKEDTGTISTLLEKFNGPYSTGYEGRTVEEWPAADEPYEVTIQFGTVSCNLYVKVESNALTDFNTAISEDSPIEVEYGNAAGLVISAGKLGWDYHYPLRSEKLKFMVGFNGEEPQEYTSEQLRKKFGEEPKRLWEEETGQENWKPGNVYGIQYQFLGKTCTVPVKVVAARHTLDKLEYSGGTLVLAKGVHNQITQWKDIFDFQSLEDWPLLDITYDGKSTPEKMTWARAEELFGCEPSRIDMQLRNDKAWEVGEEGCVTYVGIRGQMVEIPIKIIAEPIVSLKPVEPITLICRENSDACYLPTYEYEFNVQLTQEAADAYNEGETSLTGTLNEICEKLNYRGWYEYLISSDQSEDNVWTPGDGKDHYFTVHLGKDFEVPVTLKQGKVITIDEESFPDENFRKYLKANWADEADTILAEAVTEIYCQGWGIKDLTGIQLFPNLRDLNCSGNELTELSINSANLRILSCYGNKLTNLDVSNCPNLTYLDCDSNSVRKLDVSKNPALEMLYCADNGLRTLDVSKNTSLTLLYCAYNELTALDVSKNTALIELNCGNNPLPTLDVSKNLTLETLYCDNNKLTTLNVSNNTRLEKLDCSYNQLTVIYLPGTKVETNILSHIAAFFAPATYANETNTVALTELNCSGNNLSEIDASSCKKLEKLTCVDNGSDKLTVNVAKLEGLNLATVGADDVEIVENGKKVQGSSVGGEIAEQMNGAELTLTNREKTYKTTVFGPKYRFDAVANGEYKLTITPKSDEGALVPYTTTVKIVDGKGLDLANVVLVQKGDVNLDGAIDVYDLQRLYEHASQINLLSGYALAVSNINGSGNAETNMQALFEQLTKTSKEGIDSAKTG